MCKWVVGRPFNHNKFSLNGKFIINWESDFHSTYMIIMYKRMSYVDVI